MISKRYANASFWELKSICRPFGWFFC